MVQLGIFAAVTAGALTVLLTLSGLRHGSRAAVRRRLADEFGPGGAAASPLYKDLGDPDSWDAAGPDAPSADAPGPAALLGWRGGAEDFLRRAGVPLAPRQFAWAVAGAGVLLGGVGLAAGGWALAGAGVVAGAAAPLLAAAARAKARREKYQKQLVGGFELIARVLRAGLSVNEAIRAAVEAFEDPLAGEFGRCLHQIEHGLRPEAAYRELSERSGVLELRIFVVAMTVQRQSGGNLAEVLERLAALVRARVRLGQKIRALTAEGRLQSATLFVLPPLTFAVMYFLNRSYAEALLARPGLLLATAGCMAVGALWIRNIMDFEG